MARKSVSGYQKWKAKNLDVIKKRATIFLKNVEKPALAEKLKDVAQQIVNAIDGDEFQIPVYTGNLKASTGVGVYVDGVLTSFIPTSKAVKIHRSGFGELNRYGIDGSQFLENTLNEAASSFSSGVWIVLFSTVPYAYRINDEGSPLGRGQGFFNATASEMAKDVLLGLKEIGDGSIGTAMQMSNLVISKA